MQPKASSPSVTTTVTTAGASATSASTSRDSSFPTVARLSPFLAGIAGGSASTILLYPLDLVKVRLQVDENARSLTATTSSSKETAAGKSLREQQRPRGNVICNKLRGIVRHEGYKGLYRGLAPSIVGSAASWGGFFILYEDLKRRMLRHKQANSEGSRTMNVRSEIGGDGHASSATSVITSAVTLGPSEHFAASCLAGATMVLLTNPLWLIKTRLQLQSDKLQSDPNVQRKGVKPPYRGAVHAASTIVREEGLLALYKGSVPALMLVSHGGIQFVSYEFLKGRFGKWMNAGGGGSREKSDAGAGGRRKSVSIADRFQQNLGYLVMGAVSKFMASTATYPLQVIKSRLQQRAQMVEIADSGEVVISKREYSGVFECVSKIWRNEGIGGFFKGCIPNAIRVAPSAAITFVVYEMVLDALTE